MDSQGHARLPGHPGRTAVPCPLRKLVPWRTSARSSRIVTGVPAGAPGREVSCWPAPPTQAWLAVSPDPDSTVTGGYFYHQKPRPAHPAARDHKIQDQLLRYCAALTGVTL
jgi:hypothetical protein